MKKLWYVLVLALVMVLAVTTLVACGDEDKEKEFSGLSFDNKTVVYDGTEHSIEITGNVPDGASVKYTNNKGTDAGSYSASVTISMEGYKTLQLQATLTIDKATFTGITLPSMTVFQNGKVHSLKVEGTLPQGTTVTYQNNDKTERGEYTVTATLENKNYNTLVLEGKLYIRSLADAVGVVNRLLNRPDLWSFLPQALSNENMSYNNTPNTDFATSAVNVNDIAKKFIGKQLKVLYDTLNTAQSILQKADTVFTAGEAISSVYQKFISDNPDNYNEFTGDINIAGAQFKIKIVLEGEYSKMLIGNSSINIELDADSQANTNSARIQLSDGLALKYEMSDTSLRFAVKGTVKGVEVAQTIEFARNNDVVTGYLYEYYGYKDKAIKTTAVITFTEDYTYIVGNKRETDDLLIDAYQEVYDSKTGYFVGAEVTETVKAVDFDTLWFNLYDVTGINTVKVLDESNGLNADTVYVNGSETPFEIKNISLINPSRRYDIEMKQVWYIVTKQSPDGKVTYTTVEAQIPMLFVQKKSINTFTQDVTEKNDYLTTCTLPANNINVVTANFELMQETYTELKTQMSYDDIDAFIGKKDQFFE